MEEGMIPHLQSVIVRRRQGRNSRSDSRLSQARVLGCVDDRDMHLNCRFCSSRALMQAGWQGRVEADNSSGRHSISCEIQTDIDAAGSRVDWCSALVWKN